MRGEKIMNTEAFVVKSKKNPVISLGVTEGHFSTNHFHTTHYIDLDELKSNVSLARKVARELSLKYLSNTQVDTIVCMEGTEVVGTFLAEELLKVGADAEGDHTEIHVVTPVSNVNGKLMFQNNTQRLIYNRNILLLLSTISSGTTLNNALRFIAYYGGDLVGISALFNAYTEKLEHDINSLFTMEDIPDYQVFRPTECPICKRGRKLDAIIIHDGYIKVN
jgi:orotate phosphoribosyltransferase